MPARSEEFRRERLELYAEEEAYLRRSESTLHSVDVLESVVEGVRLDVVERRCKVLEGETEGLSLATESAMSAIQELKSKLYAVIDKSYINFIQNLMIMYNYT